MTCFFDDVRVFFSFLFDEYGFIEVDKSYSNEYFGNSIIILQNNDIIIRIVSERDQVFLDIAPVNPITEWFDLDTLISYLESQKTFISPEKQFLTKHDMIETSTELKKYFRDITELFIGKLRDIHIKQLKDYKMKRARARFGL